MKHLAVEEGNICSGELRSEWQAQVLVEASGVILKEDTKQLWFYSDTRTQKPFFFPLKSVINVFLPTPCFHDGAPLNYAKYYYGDSWSVENTVQVTKQHE